jgi:hypothetical protein
VVIEIVPDRDRRYCIGGKSVTILMMEGLKEEIA